MNRSDDIIEAIGGNLTQREDVLAAETESFNYDSLDRLVAASSPSYSQTYTYDEIGNITNMNGTEYTYGSQPHAVTAAGQASYTYDANGNMTDRDGQTITWDVENRPVSITDGQNTTTYVYDGDGNRILETEGGETILYVNGYYEKNITTSVITTYYYLGSRLIAQRKGTDLRYMHQDHLTGTSLTTDSNGNSEGTIKYYPYGDCRNSTGTIATDKLFTGQRLDSTGLYYYNARYYDPSIGRFISADTIIPNPANPQSLNRYSYCLNNPLKYTDPSGHWFETLIDIASLVWSVYDFINEPSWENAGYIALDVVTLALPFVAAGGTIVKAAVHGDDIVDAVKAVTKVDDITDVTRSAGILDDAVEATFRGGKYTDVTLQPGDKIYRAYEAGNPNSNIISRYATDLETSSSIKSTQSAIDQLALGTTSGAKPNRLVELEITRPITVQYGLIEGGGKNAYQYYIDPKYFDALKVNGVRVLK